jgi:benzoylformate decarboxylase
VNREYRLLKDLWCRAMGTSLETTRVVGMDFTDPDVDMHGIAASLGARTEEIRDPEAVREILAQSLAHQGPSLPHRRPRAVRRQS